MTAPGFISTRAAEAAPIGFAEAILSGLAPDGGLFIPMPLPRFDSHVLDGLRGGTLTDCAIAVASAFAGSDADSLDWQAICTAPYAAFRHPSVAPLMDMGRDLWMLELYHGPTLSFKDYALQPLGQLTGSLLRAEGRPAVVIGATSGDTGSAAIAGFAGLDNIDVFIMHPTGRVSDVQRQQMTTVTAPNVHNIAIEGTFDDCQQIAKTLLASPASLTPDHRVLSVNSINVGRIMFQVAYHLHTALRLTRDGRGITACVPSGNFGNALSALLAAEMGAPIDRVIVATNANDLLARAINQGHATPGSVAATDSPAMDIQVPSNLERLFHALVSGDGAKTARAFTGLKQQQALTMPDGWQAKLPIPVEAAAITDAETEDWIRRIFATTDRIVCPHSAVGFAAADRFHRPGKDITVTLATAHPAKFPDVVTRALGFAPLQPAPLAALSGLEERVTSLPADATRVSGFIRRTIGID